MGAGQMLKVDAVTGDLTLDAEVVDGADAILQDVRLRCRLFLGEWFLNTEVGVPYLQQILGTKKPNLDLVRQALRDAVEETPGVDRVLSIQVTLDKAGRTATVRFTASTDEGELADTFTVGAE